ncbi:alpha/beta fold hydrolase [Bradyrhizobium sp. STM 3557]|uniref:alpha/beta fold hydrolase n=1 Tax=Bradyrhizobium sp. STM 3557 TaxID=578920 RepID=UPI003890A9B4
MLLHGSAFDAAGVSFGATISVLATRCRVFAPDLPGFGESDPMPDGWALRSIRLFLPRCCARSIFHASLSSAYRWAAALRSASRSMHRSESTALR